MQLCGTPLPLATVARRRRSPSIRRRIKNVWDRHCRRKLVDVRDAADFLRWPVVETRVPYDVLSWERPLRCRSSGMLVSPAPVGGFSNKALSATRIPAHPHVRVQTVVPVVPHHKHVSLGDDQGLQCVGRRLLDVRLVHSNAIDVRLSLRPARTIGLVPAFSWKWRDAIADKCAPASLRFCPQRHQSRA